MKVIQHSNGIDLWIDGILLDPPLSPVQLSLVKFILNHTDEVVLYNEIHQYMYGSEGKTKRFDALVYRVNKRVPMMIKRKRGHGVYVEK